MGDLMNVYKCKLIVALLPLLICRGSVSGQSAPAVTLPNIILIVADDLGNGDLGCYGQRKIATPNIDALAAKGMLFKQFYAGTSVCAPSRASLMTGLHTGHTPVRGNREVQPEGQFPLPAHTLTIASMLKQQGYVTGDFGKWGLGYVGSTGDPLKQGFDYFFGYNCQRQSHNYYPDHLWKQDQQVKFDLNRNDNFHDYAPDIIQRQARSFIRENRSKPFFLYLSYTLPHAALQVGDDSLFNAYKNKFNEQPVPVKEPWDGTGYAPQAYPHAAYATMVGKLDQYVGEVMKDVEENGLSPNTIVIFTSDNGPHKEGGNDPEFFNSNMGLRGFKRDLYEGGIRVPMIVSWPGTIKPGMKSEHVGAFWDLLPTFAALSKTTLREYTDGVSFLPELIGQRQQSHELLYWEFHEGGGSQAVRMDQWKGVRRQVVADANAPVELYDLKHDAAEKNDISKKYPEIIRRMRIVMEQQHVENENFPLFKKADQ
jgi:arylsulfatase A